MKGISYLTDDKNNRKAVVLDLKIIMTYRGNWGDLFDGLIAESRRDEPKIGWEQVKENLKKKGKL